VTATMPVLEAAIALALLLLGVSASSAGSSDQYEDYRRSAANRRVVPQPDIPWVSGRTAKYAIDPPDRDV